MYQHISCYNKFVYGNLNIAVPVLIFAIVTKNVGMCTLRIHYNIGRVYIIGFHVRSMLLRIFLLIKMCTWCNNSLLRAIGTTFRK